MQLLVFLKEFLMNVSSAASTFAHHAAFNPNNAAFNSNRAENGVEGNKPDGDGDGDDKVRAASTASTGAASPRSASAGSLIDVIG